MWLSVSVLSMKALKLHYVVDGTNWLKMIENRWWLVLLSGCTPLHWAAMRGNLEACTVLVQAGSLADLLATDSTGCTAVQLASDKGHRHVAFFLVIMFISNCVDFLQHLEKPFFINLWFLSFFFPLFEYVILTGMPAFPKAACWLLGKMHSQHLVDPKECDYRVV
jgi:hypothetical protein